MTEVLAQAPNVERRRSTTPTITLTDMAVGQTDVFYDAPLEEELAVPEHMAPPPPIEKDAPSAFSIRERSENEPAVSTITSTESTSLTEAVVGMDTDIITSAILDLLSEGEQAEETKIQQQLSEQAAEVVGVKDLQTEILPHEHLVQHQVSAPDTETIPLDGECDNVEEIREESTPERVEEFPEVATPTETEALFEISAPPQLHTAKMHLLPGTSSIVKVDSSLITLALMDLLSEEQMHEEKEGEQETVCKDIDSTREVEQATSIRRVTSEIIAFIEEDFTNTVGCTEMTVDNLYATGSAIVTASTIETPIVCTSKQVITSTVNAHSLILELIEQQAEQILQEAILEAVMKRQELVEKEFEKSTPPDTNKLSVVPEEDAESTTQRIETIETAPLTVETEVTATATSEITMPPELYAVDAHTVPLTDSIVNMDTHIIRLAIVDLLQQNQSIRQATESQVTQEFEPEAIVEEPSRTPSAASSSEDFLETLVGEQQEAEKVAAERAEVQRRVLVETLEKSATFQEETLLKSESEEPTQPLIVSRRANVVDEQSPDIITEQRQKGDETLFESGASIVEESMSETASLAVNAPLRQRSLSEATETEIAPTLSCSFTEIVDSAIGHVPYSTLEAALADFRLAALSYESTAPVMLHVLMSSTDLATLSPVPFRQEILPEITVTFADELTHFEEAESVEHVQCERYCVRRDLSTEESHLEHYATIAQSVSVVNETTVKEDNEHIAESTCDESIAEYIEESAREEITEMNELQRKSDEILTATDHLIEELGFERVPTLLHYITATVDFALDEENPSQSAQMFFKTSNQHTIYTAASEQLYIAHYIIQISHHVTAQVLQPVWCSAWSSTETVQPLEHYSTATVTSAFVKSANEDVVDVEVRQMQRIRSSEWLDISAQQRPATDSIALLDLHRTSVEEISTKAEPSAIDSTLKSIDATTCESINLITASNQRLADSLLSVQHYSTAAVESSLEARELMHELNVHVESPELIVVSDSLIDSSMYEALSAENRVMPDITDETHWSDIIVPMNHLERDDWTGEQLLDEFDQEITSTEVEALFTPSSADAIATVHVQLPELHDSVEVSVSRVQCKH